MILTSVYRFIIFTSHCSYRLNDLTIGDAQRNIVLTTDMKNNIIVVHSSVLVWYGTVPIVTWNLKKKKIESLNYVRTYVRYRHWFHTYVRILISEFRTVIFVSFIGLRTYVVRISTSLFQF